jgi:esterase/lipase superfamily enzyme
MTRASRSIADKPAGDNGLTRRRTSAWPWLLIVAVSCGLAGCARPGPSVLIPTQMVAPGAKLVTVYVATTRQREPDSAIVYTTDRAPKLGYAEFTIAIPPHHKPGEIEWPAGTPNPETDFVTVQQRILSSAEFEGKVSARAPGSDGRKAGVFIHGYNVSFQESVFRLAQMASDADIDGIPILFAWPAGEKLVGYVADKEAATYSRDALVQLLTMLARDRRPADVTLLGHSMGAWLTVEALRQLRLTGRSATLAHLNVILAAPDIDLDVFSAQARVIGPLTPPMTVLVSPDDKALAFAGSVSGDRKRLGALDVDSPGVKEAARAAGIRIVDISNLKSPDPLNHDGYVTYATLYSRLGGMERRRAGGDFGQTGAFIVTSFGSALASPFTLFGSVLAGQ